MAPDNRRSFVKKSLATSVSISFTGLLRAHGEEGGGNPPNNPNFDPNQATVVGTGPWGGTIGETDPWDQNQSTDPGTDPGTTIVTTFDPYVLVCMSAPSSPSRTATGNNKATETGGQGIIDPFQLMGLDVNFTGPSNGHYSFTTFELRVEASCSTLGDPVESTVAQVVSFNAPQEIIYSPADPMDMQLEGRNSRDLSVITIIRSGATQSAGVWSSGVSSVDFGNGNVLADISTCGANVKDEGWTFSVMLLSEAIAYQESLNE